jgi:PleD family two-component response regulator
MAALPSLVEIGAELLLPEKTISGNLPQSEPKLPGEKQIAMNNRISIFMLVCNIRTRDYLWSLLTQNNYSPLLVTDPEELLHSLKENHFAVVLIDCSAVTSYGTRILSKIKVACQRCRIIIFCDKEHLCDKPHRDLIKEVLDIGVYACILAPYKEWEVLSMFSYFPLR